MPSLHRRRFHAPQEDGAALLEPPLSEAARLIESNRQISNQFDRLGVLPADRDRKLARLALLTTAGGLSGRELKDAAHQPLILSGHQPELFHPGVWFKNFVVSSIAKAHAGAAINLPQSQLSVDRLDAAIRGLVENPAEMQRLADGASRRARPHAAEEIAQRIIALIRRR